MVRRNSSKKRPFPAPDSAVQPPSSILSQPAFCPPVLSIPPTPLLSEEQIEQIHKASMVILSQYGVEVMSLRARALYRKAGAEVDEASETVRMDEALATALLASTP